MKTAEALKKEVEGAAKPYLEQIRELEDKIKHRQQTVDRLKSETREKLQEAERLEAVAQQALENGEDPREVLQEASRLRNEAQDLEGFLEKQGAEAEREKLNELKQDMSRELKRTVQASRAYRQQSKAILQALREVVRIHDEWEEALNKAFGEMGLEKKDRFQLLQFQDDSEEVHLTKRLQPILNKYSHLFTR